MSDATIRVAVDIGGTFTDIQVLDLANGRLFDFKSPTTPDDPSRGLIAGLRGAADRGGFDLSRVGMILHGSTIATNAVLERKLPRGALLTTAGFEDVLEIGRHMRRNVYALRAEERAVLIPRDRRIGVDERIRASGEVERPLDAEAVHRIGTRLAEEGVEAVAVMFLHAYRNPAHEEEAAGILSAMPGLAVTTSAETSAEVREFERASTTVLNALLKPVICDYLGRLRGRLAEAGIAAPLYLVQSNGGLASPEETARLPARLLLSGPSGGAMAMVDLARRHGLADVVGIDMGGTSSDVSVVREGRVEETRAGEIDGLPVRLPMVEIRTIGAGGGSLARTDGTALRVGPESAGSAPGPACYGRGGTEPTVTDANLALGLIDPDAFLGGQMALSTEAAGRAVDSLAGPLSLDREEAAAGILAIANAAMAGAVRLSLFEKGADPTDFALAAFGGAGGLHACAIADDLDIRRILFPQGASTLSARGILTSDLRHDLSSSRLMLATPEAAPRLAEMAAELHERGSRLLEDDAIPAADRRIAFSADMRYRGQAFELVTPWDALSPDSPPDVTPEAIESLVTAFHELHRTRYAHAAPSDPVEIVTLRARAIGRISRELHPDPPPVRAAASRTRQVWQDGWRDIPVIRREAVTDPVAGPALIVEDYSVLWIAANWTVRPDKGDLIAERRA